MSFNIIHNTPPKLKMPEFTCDIELHKNLNDDPILKYMNKTFACAIIGKKGSGKTSLLLSWIQTEKKLKKVFYQIFVFMPETSRASIKNSILDKLPPEQFFNYVSFDNLQNIYNILKQNTKKKEFTMLIFDDVQSQFKSPEIEKALLHLISNARHLRCCIFIIAQNWNKIPNNIRMSMNDLFLFNISKTEYDKMYDEYLEINKNDFETILKLYKKYKLQNEHSFIYIHEKIKTFINFDEIVFDD